MSVNLKPRIDLSIHSDRLSTPAGVPHWNSIKKVSDSLINLENRHEQNLRMENRMPWPSHSVADSPPTITSWKDSFNYQSLICPGQWQPERYVPTFRIAVVSDSEFSILTTVWMNQLLQNISVKTVQNNPKINKIGHFWIWKVSKINGPESTEIPRYFGTPGLTFIQQIAGRLAQPPAIL